MDRDKQTRCLKDAGPKWVSGGKVRVENERGSAGLETWSGGKTKAVGEENRGGGDLGRARGWQYKRKESEKRKLRGITRRNTRI